MVTLRVTCGMTMGKVYRMKGKKSTNVRTEVSEWEEREEMRLPFRDGARQVGEVAVLRICLGD